MVPRLHHSVHVMMEYEVTLMDWSHLNNVYPVLRDTTALQRTKLLQLVRIKSSLKGKLVFHV